MLYFLQETIEKVYGGIVLYCDTDSVYCLMPKNHFDLEDMEFKMSFGIKDECHIKDANEWACIAPKCYSYTNGKNYCTTSKGVSIQKIKHFSKPVELANK